MYVCVCVYTKTYIYKLISSRRLVVKSHFKLKILNILVQYFTLLRIREKKVIFIKHLL